MLIHGDAPPLFLGALMAKRQRLKVAQVEAGSTIEQLFKTISRRADLEFFQQKLA